MKKNVLKAFKYKKLLLLSAVMVALVLGVVFFRSQKANGKIKEIGDYVYSDEVKIKTGSGDDAYDTISGYSGFNWSNIESIMNTNITRLVNEYARDYSDGVLSNLNPDSKPEGQIWKKNGDLSLSGTVSGKGTIIIEGGNLTIDGNLQYPENDTKSSVGFIVIGKDGVGGSVIINGNVDSTVGAYYASNEIIFN